MIPQSGTDIDLHMMSHYSHVFSALCLNDLLNLNMRTVKYYRCICTAFVTLLVSQSTLLFVRMHRYDFSCTIERYRESIRSITFIEQCRLGSLVWGHKPFLPEEYRLLHANKCRKSRHIAFISNVTQGFCYQILVWHKTSDTNAPF